ncbi:hypothetical protein Tco_1006232 [Tanacetum coccineum]|uniref:Uncharacterized protein n=1 Tax=Tanacetum coccineum TaxID=301880 RepID=A0ABQ5FHP6_9ASTR
MPLYLLSTEDVVSTVKEGVSTDGSKVSTDRQVEGAEEQVKGTDELKEGTEEHNESTEEQREGTEEKVESTDGQIKGTEDQAEEEMATQATQTSTQTPTSKIFGDDETIAKVLLNMSQAKAASREKEKGVELKDVEETDRPKPTSTRSLLTLKPLLHQIIAFYQSSCKTFSFSLRSWPLATSSPFLQGHIHQSVLKTKATFCGLEDDDAVEPFISLSNTLKLLYKSSKLRVSTPGLVLIIKETYDQAEGRDLRNF